MFLSVLFACSAEFQSLDHKEPTYVNEMFASQSDKVRNDPRALRGNIEFTSHASIDSFCEDHTSVVGDVYIFGKDIRSLEGLSCLEQVSGLSLIHI